MGFFGKKEVHHEYDPMVKILESIRSCIETKAEIHDKQVFCPAWKITIVPHIEELTDNSAVINFNIYCPDWDEPLFECCAGVGKDKDTAIGVSVGSFLFAFMQGIAMMMNDSEPAPLKSEFAGHSHRWRMYRSNIVGMGQNPGGAVPDSAQYWDLLKEHIAKRIGNQNLCYVKIYAAKSVGSNGENVMGECRINDVPSEELGKLVKEAAEKWSVEQFASQKQFFFIKQESETRLPYPYTGADKLKKLSEAVTKAVEILCAVTNDEEYEKALPKLKAAVGDNTLAEECYLFLPEICAERAFNQVQFSEQLNIGSGKETTEIVYKNQLADFYPLCTTLFTMFDRGIYGEQTNDIYKMLIGFSSVYGAVRQMQEKGRKLEGCKMTSMFMNVTNDFDLR